MNELRKKMAQMLMMGFHGKALEEMPKFRQFLSKEGLGGIILFTKNMSSISQTELLLKDLKSLTEIPLLAAIDDEGGEVNRFMHFKEPFWNPPSAEDVATLPTAKQEEIFEKMAERLHELGFNLNFAPVVDLAIESEKGIIAKKKRSFSKDPNEVIAISKRFIEAFKKKGLICCIKHFPGHGSASLDSHLGAVDVSLTFTPLELEPYRKLCQLEESLLPLVMTAHVLNRQLSDDDLPTSLSPQVITSLLREEIGFRGIIVSDDLQMSAISANFSLEESIFAAINAGSDMIIIANQLGDISPDEVLDIMVKLVEKGKLSAERIETSFKRIESLKKYHLY